MHALTEAPGEFAQDHVFGEFRHEKNSASHPEEKDEERQQPREPTGPGCGQTIGPLAPLPLKANQSRKKKRVDNRPLDEHSGAEQEKEQNLVSRSPAGRSSDFFPNQAADRKENEREGQVGANQGSQARHEQVEAQGASGYHGCDRAVNRRGADDQG